MASTGSSTSGTTTTGNEIISSVNKTSGSGIDLKSLVTGLVNAETSVAQSQITKKVENTNLSISSFGNLSSRMNTLNTELTNLEETNARATTSSNSGVILTVTDEANAVDVSSSIVVSTLARGQTVSFDLTNNGFANAFSSSSSRTASSSIDQGTMVFTLGSTATTITINSTNNTLQGLVDEINKITGVQATLIDTDGSGSLSLSIRSDTGANNSFSISSGSGDLSAFNTGDYSDAWVARQTTAADASFTVDGVTVTRSSNTITDLFAGHTINLTAADSSTAVEVTSALATTDARARMQSFIDSINTVKTFLKTETQRGLNGAKPGSLAGDVTATAILRELSALTTTPITGYGSTDYYLANLGVRTERDGTLSLDTTAFDAAILADPTVADIVFSSKYSATDANLSVTGLTNYPPEPGSYSFSYNSGASTGLLDSNSITPLTNSKSQKVFTGTSGNSKNLSVTMLSDTTTSGTVRFGRSMIDTLQAYIETLTSSSGTIKTRSDTLTADLATYADDQADLDAKIEALTNDYNVKFGSMEAMVTQLNKTGQYLTSMMDAWNKKD
ncbi:flagellar filament capping protein FliD [Rhodobacteraceae bacterium IMCC15231]|nr:flagellar filament capping protein FliD [Rhodobacteraceae bacterium IMCC15231]